MGEKRDWNREELQRGYLETMTAVTLPVNIKLDGTTRIYDLGKAEVILSRASIISLAPCDCRERVQACDNPLDVCLSIDKEAEQMISDGRGRRVSLQEALAAL